MDQATISTDIEDHVLREIFSKAGRQFPFGVNPRIGGKPSRYVQTHKGNFIQCELTIRCELPPKKSSVLKIKSLQA